MIILLKFNLLEILQRCNILCVCYSDWQLINDKNIFWTKWYNASFLTNCRYLEFEQSYLEFKYNQANMLYITNSIQFVWMCCYNMLFKSICYQHLVSTFHSKHSKFSIYLLLLKQPYFPFEISFLFCGEENYFSFRRNEFLIISSQDLTSLLWFSYDKTIKFLTRRNEN